MSDEVLVEVDGPVARVTLNAPDRLNALSETMIDDLHRAVAELDARPDVRVVGLTGAGRGFCSGANLELPDDGSGAIPTGTLDAIGRYIRLVAGLDTPMVALVNGVAAGVGVSLALVCPYVVASEKASFVLAFSRIGLMPDGGSTALVAASIGRARALRMALTGEKVDAETAAAWGLVAETVPAGEFGARCAAVLDLLAGSAPRAVAATVAAVDAASLDLQGALTREEAGQLALLHSEDFLEGVRAFKEKRPATFRGA